MILANHPIRDNPAERKPIILNQPVVFSFDVEEHDRIEAAAELTFTDEFKATYAQRMELTTRRLLELLEECGVKASFYIVGEIAQTHPKLVRDIAEAGHEVGSHSWKHWRVHRFHQDEFREDLRCSRDALEQACGQKVVGFRAPTFSVDHRVPWAIDTLVELGFRYDTSIFPVRHDRYGVPTAPRVPFLVKGCERALIELPPTTYRLLGQNMPVAGGGYFRLFPLFLMKAGLNQLGSTPGGVGMLYFHPWEFDPDQPRLPLKPVSRWRTYVGIRQSIPRLRQLLLAYQSRAYRAIDVLPLLEAQRDQLPRFQL